MIPYLNGTLSLHLPLLRNSFENHIETCSTCIHELNALKSTDSMLDSRVQNLPSRVRSSGDSISRKVSIELEAFDQMQQKQSLMIKRVLIGAACAFILFAAGLYFTIGRQTIAAVLPGTPYFATPAANSGQPIPSPTLSNLLGIHKRGSHEPTTAAVLR